MGNTFLNAGKIVDLDNQARAGFHPGKAGKHCVPVRVAFIKRPMAVRQPVSALQMHMRQIHTRRLDEVSDGRRPAGAVRPVGVPGINGQFERGRICRRNNSTALSGIKVLDVLSTMTTP